jgi:hypothetical protein
MAHNIKDFGETTCEVVNLINMVQDRGHIEGFYEEGNEPVCSLKL